MLKEAIYIATGKQLGTIPFPQTAQVARKAAEEGMVLLKNDGTLPLAAGKVALFGAGASDTVICGTGSGYAFSPYKVTVKEGLEKAGFSVTSGGWLKKYEEAAKKAEKEQKFSIISKRWSGLTVEIEVPEVTMEDIVAAGGSEHGDSSETGTAIYVIRRNTGENFDRKAEKGDYYLSDQEAENIRRIAAAFPKTIVVLNTCVIDAVELNQIEGVGAIVLMGQAGMEAGNALANILTGKVCPSGRLTDTWALSYSDYPASATFSANDGITLEEDYSEDIYVGYRYFDSKGLKVQYPFGYGLSYTTFAMTCTGAKADWQQISLDVSVKNTGEAAGKEVIQVYVSAPAGKLNKPYQELKAYRKTKTLKPGEEQTLTLTFPTESLASYSEEQAAWIMEEGAYIIRVGNHSRHTGPAAVLNLTGEAKARQVSNHMAPVKEMDLLKMEPLAAGPLAAVELPYAAEQPVGTELVVTSAQTAETDPGVSSAQPAGENAQTDKAQAEFTLSLNAADCTTIQNISRIPKETITYIPEGSDYRIPDRKFHFPFDLEEKLEVVRNCPDSTLQDVRDGKVTLEEFVASLDAETLMRIVTGSGSETKYPVPVRKKGLKKNKIAMAASGKTTGQYAESLGIPQGALCDGPAGLHLMGSNCTAFPVGMVAAQTWNTAALRNIGDSYALELEKYLVNVALGPGMNIHRDPLCGRNFEYYSEDPLLTGKTAAAFTHGIQDKHPRCCVSLKHFACNNQEIDRTLSSSNVSERALREIYLKGFEICVREAAPRTVMTSYNCINGIHTSSRYDLLTDILRGEWGFQGLIMTDWDSKSDKPYDLHAGNDIIMGGYRTDLLGTSVYGTAPEFGEDGAVFEQEVKAYGGFFKNKIVKWNAFLPDKDGADTVSTTVKAGTQISPRVQEAVDAGYAEVSPLENGDTKVTYRGCDRGSWLPIGDLQKCAINVLKFLLQF